MRKIVSAILMCLLLLNWFGYNLVANYVQQRFDNQLEASLDNNQYDESQLIALKIPLNLPYQTNWSAFERYDGEIEMNGILYKYVKRKVANDTLVLLCIPNRQKMDLQTARSDFFKHTNDLAQNNGSKKSDQSKATAFKKLSGDYDDHSYIFNANALSYSQPDNGFSYLYTTLLFTPHMSPEQPPDLTAA